MMTEITFVLDWTASMGVFCSSLPKTLHEVICLADVLFNKKCKINIIAYGDYCDGENRTAQRQRNYKTDRISFHPP